MRQWLRDIRLQAGYNQSELAKILEVSKSYISEIENGNRTPSGMKAYKIAKTLEFKMERFYEDAQ